MNSTLLKFRLKLILRSIILSIFLSTIIIYLSNSYPNLSYAFLFSIYFGLIIGVIEDIFFFSQIKKLPFLLNVFIKLISIISIYISFVISATYFATFSISESFDKLIELRALGIIYRVLFIAFLIITYNEISLFLGHQFATNHLFGTYHKAKSENRIFMFLDLKKSTSITEQIGDIRYYNFINDCFFTMSKYVIMYNAEIVKYVGDEVILTWKTNNSKNCENAIQFYIDFTNKLNSNSNYFVNKYGISPEFTAAIHKGMVVTANLGHLKKQLDFSGGVMNTCARIQGKCSTLKANLLVSEEIVKSIDLSKYDHINFEKIELKGKKESKNLIQIKGNK